MANLPKFTTDVNNIQALSDRPNEQDGLSSAELKAKFDKAVSDIKDYINNTLTTAVDNNISEIDGEIDTITGETIATLFDTYMESVRAQEYPVGRIVMFYDNADHSNYLGYTWIRTCVGRVPVGYDTTQTEFNTIGKTGGEKTHKLNISELPSHNHVTELRNQSDTETLKVTISGQNKVYGTGQSGILTNAAGWGSYPHAGWLTIKNNYTGESQGHNNIQPYEVVSFWKRIS